MSVKFYFLLILVLAPCLLFSQNIPLRTNTICVRHISFDKIVKAPITYRRTENAAPLR